MKTVLCARTIGQTPDGNYTRRAKIACAYNTFLQSVLNETKTHPALATTATTIRIRFLSRSLSFALSVSGVVWCACVCVSPIWRIGSADDFSRYRERCGLF